MLLNYNLPLGIRRWITFLSLNAKFQLKVFLYNVMIYKCMQKPIISLLITSKILQNLPYKEHNTTLTATYPSHIQVLSTDQCILPYRYGHNPFSKRNLWYCKVTYQYCCPRKTYLTYTPEIITNEIRNECVLIFKMRTASWYLNHKIATINNICRLKHLELNFTPSILSVNSFMCCWIHCYLAAFVR